MTKKKKILNGIIFLVGLIVFLFYYFEDKTDTEVIEEKHKESATESADTTLNVLDNIVTDDPVGVFNPAILIDAILLAGAAAAQRQA